MKDRNFGQVVPFRLSASRLRRGASDYRRRGQPVEALELLRRAAQEEDDPSGWLALAQSLREQGCWEQAANLLLRLLAREAFPPETWLELGRCLRLSGLTELAADCLYHYLQEDAWSAEADEARAMLADLEPSDARREAGRLPLLTRRGLTAWRTGERALAFRRLQRALHLSGGHERLRETMALLLLAEQDERDALREAARAVHGAPESAQAWMTLCAVLEQMDRPRMARAALRRCADNSRDAAEERMFLADAWAMNAYPELERFLNERLQRRPNRIALLHPLADVSWATGHPERARRIWRHILRIDPEDRRARALAAWAHDRAEGELPPWGSLPLPVIERQLRTLAEAVRQNVPEEELIRPGTETRAVLDECFSAPDEAQQTAALSMVSDGEGPAVIRYLREKLVSLPVLPSVRRSALLRLAALGQTGPMQMLMAGRITTVQCQPITPDKPRLWRAFLPTLLAETRWWDQSPEIVGFAAELWPLMTSAQRQSAAGPERFTYVKAIELLYLRVTGQEDAAESAVTRLTVSARRVGRVLRALARDMEAPSQHISEDERHEVH